MTKDPVTIGFASAMPYIAIILSQYPGLFLAKKIKQQQMLIIFGTIAKLIWYPLLFYLTFTNITNISARLIVIFIGIYWFFYYLPQPTWTTISAKIVEKKVRGRVFAIRDNLIYFAYFFVMILAGLYFKWFNNFFGDKPEVTKFSFILLFFIALIFGLISILTYSFIKINDTTLKFKTQNLFKLPEKRLLKYMFAMMIANFAIMLASPFFTVKLLQDMELSYSFFSILSAIDILIRAIAFKHWGDIIDKYGNRLVLITSILGISGGALLFSVMTKNTVYLTIMAYVVLAIGWAGFTLSSFNILLNVTKNSNRTISAASFNIITALPAIIAPIIGGFIVKYTTLDTIFIVSGLLRFVCLFAFISITEIKIFENNYKIKNYFRDLFDIFSHKKSSISSFRLFLLNVAYLNKYMFKEVEKITRRKK